MIRLTATTIVSLLLVSSLSAAEWQPRDGNKLEAKADKAVNAFRSRQPRTLPYFDQSYGWAIFPSVTRVGLGFGGAYGKGVVVEGDQRIGSTTFKQFTSGIQAGARNFSMILFFKDEAALEHYQSGKTRFLGQAGLALGPLGVAGTPAYNEGVAIVTMTRLGLMGEFTVSGAKFSYQPYPGH